MAVDNVNNRPPCVQQPTSSLPNKVRPTSSSGASSEFGSQSDELPTASSAFASEFGSQLTQQQPTGVSHLKVRPTSTTSAFLELGSQPDDELRTDGSHSDVGPGFGSQPDQLETACRYLKAMPSSCFAAELGGFSEQVKVRPSCAAGDVVKVESDDEAGPASSVSSSSKRPSPAQVVAAATKSLARKLNQIDVTPPTPMAVKRLKTQGLGQGPAAWQDPLLQALHAHPALRNDDVGVGAAAPPVVPPVKQPAAIKSLTRKHLPNTTPSAEEVQRPPNEPDQYPWRKPNPIKFDEQKMSRALTWILRHGAFERNLPICPKGYIKVEHLMQLPEFAGLSLNDFEEMVHLDAKGRYTFEFDEAGHATIAAWTGHTLPGVYGPDCQPGVSTPPILLHGSFWKHHQSMLTWGLAPTKARDIHLVDPEMPNNKWRWNLTMKVLVDTELAEELGCKFRKSGNDVWLCSNTIPPAALMSFESWDCDSSSK